MSPRGNSDGYALLDALVAILIITLIAGTALPGIGASLRAAGKSLARVSALVEKRSEQAKLRMMSDSP